MKVAISAVWKALRSIWRVSASNSPIDGGILVSYGFTLLSTPLGPLFSTSFSACRGVRRARRDNEHANSLLFRCFFFFMFLLIYAYIFLFSSFSFSNVFNCTTKLFLCLDLDSNFVVNYSIINNSINMANSAIVFLAAVACVCITFWSIFLQKLTWPILYS